jgi:hypothetical protein
LVTDAGGAGGACAAAAAGGFDKLVAEDSGRLDACGGGVGVVDGLAGAGAPGFGCRSVSSSSL